MTNDFPVSICIPTYNGAAYLKEALESALQQTYHDFEILIVDDGSTDETVKIARQYESRYENIRVVQNPSNVGLVANWMKCIELAKHKWIKFLFQDDTLEKDCLEKMMIVAKQTNKKIVLCARSFIVDSNASEQNKKYFQIITKPENLFSGPFITPHELANAVVKYETENILGEPICLLFDKTIIQEIGGFDERLNQLVDFDFVVRAGLAYGLGFIKEPLVHFRVHIKSQSAVNSPSGKKGAAIQKLIRTVFGDALLLLMLFLTDSRYLVMKEVWTEKNLLLCIRYLYLKACKRFGEKKVNIALTDVLPEMPELQNLKYNYLKYKIAKYYYKRFKSQTKKI